MGGSHERYPTGVGILFCNRQEGETVRNITLFLLIAVLLSLSTKAFAYSEQDINKLTTLAAIYGRAVACGADVDGPISRTGTWIDSTFGNDRGAYLQIFMSGMQQNAQNQASGRTGESCDSVLGSFRSMGL